MSIKLPRTSEVLTQYGANVPFGLGSHLDPSISTGVSGISVGEVPFDPALHDATDIDFGSAEEMLTGDFHVEQVIPERPLSYFTVVDATARREFDSIARTKRIARGLIAGALTDQVVSIGDRAMLEDVVGQDRQPFTVKTKDALDMGLTFALGDFEGFNAKRDLNGLVAIKVNHLLERELPANVGYISLGGAVEIDTNNPNQLAQVNDALEQKHQEVVESLESADAQVVCVVADPRLKPEFDAPKTDEDIAKAIEKLAR